MLRVHRVGLALKAFPVTNYLLGPTFIATYGERYCAQFPPTVASTSPLLHEALMLGMFIRSLTSDRELQQPHLHSIFEYEYALFVLGNDASIAEHAAECLDSVENGADINFEELAPRLGRHVM